MYRKGVVLLRWTNEGRYKHKTDLVERRFVQEEGILTAGQAVTVKFTTKKNSKVKICTAVVEKTEESEQSGKTAKKKGSTRVKTTKTVSC